MTCRACDDAGGDAAKEKVPESPRQEHELACFLAMWAQRHVLERGLPDGVLAPTHYDLMVKYGCRMDEFKRFGT